MDLREYKLGDFGNICMCKRILKSETNEDGGIPFFKIGTFGDKADVYISKEQYEDYRSRFSYPKKGDVLISAAGTIGRFVIYNGEDAYYQDSNIVWIDNDESIIRNDFLYYALKAVKWNPSKGSTILRLYNDDIRNTKIIIPADLEVQGKIASFLGNLDRKISLNRSINAELERMAKEIYDYWFVQFEFPRSVSGESGLPELSRTDDGNGQSHFPDEHGRPYKSSGGAMVYNPVLKREVPKGWEVKNLSKLGTFRNGINYAKDEIGNKDYRIANVRNVSSSTLFLNTLDLDVINLKQELADKYLVKPNDILITRSGCPGATRIIQGESDFPIIFCGFIICFTIEDIEFKKLLTYQLKQLEDVTKGQSGGSILSNISQDVLKNLFVVIPPKTIVKTFNSIIQKIWNLIDTTLEQTNEIENQRDELLPLLMTGQVEVK